MTKTGWAVDIDDTLAETALRCIEVVGEKFGFPEGLTAEQVLNMYHQPGAVPVWQTSEIQDLVRQRLQDPEWLLEVAEVPSAVKVLQKLQAEIPVSCYVTSRLSDLQAVTETWLHRHGFPSARVVTRTTQTRPDWKLEFLANEYPLSYGLIDNELGFLPIKATPYQGRLFWFNRSQAPTTNSDLVEFSDWLQLEEILLQSR